MPRRHVLPNRKRLIELNPDIVKNIKGQRLRLVRRKRMLAYAATEMEQVFEEVRQGR